MSVKEDLVRLEWKYAQDFKRVYATHTFAFGSDYDYHLMFGSTNAIMQQRPSTTPRAEGEYKVEVILPFRALKELRDRLDQAVKVLEQKFKQLQSSESNNP
jgi:hypothetical protein